MTVTEPWICPNCNCNVSTPYCPACGEHPLSQRDLTLGGLTVQIAQSLSDIDGRLLNSFRCLMMRPGTLTAAYLQGQRKPYIGPFPLFLYANVVFFATQSLTDFRIFSTLFDMHLHNQMWHDLAQFLVTQRLKVTGKTLAIVQSGRGAERQVANWLNDIAVCSDTADSVLAYTASIRRSCCFFATLLRIFFVVTLCADDGKDCVRHHWHTFIRYGSCIIDLAAGGMRCVSLCRN